MSTYVISCPRRTTVGRWTFHVDRKPTVTEAREFIQRESRGDAITVFVQIDKYEPPKVHKI